MFMLVENIRVALDENQKLASFADQDSKPHGSTIINRIDHHAQRLLDLITVRSNATMTLDAADRFFRIQSRRRRSLRCYRAIYRQRERLRISALAAFEHRTLIKFFGGE